MKRLVNWPLAISIFLLSTYSAWAVCTTPTITISSVPSSPVPANQAITITATFSNTSPVPTGQVQFADNGGSIGVFAPVVNLSGGSASLSIPASTLPQGTHNITLIYSGDATYCSANVTTPYPLVITAAVTAPATVPDLSPWGISLTALLLLSAGLAMTRRSVNS